MLRQDCRRYLNSKRPGDTVLASGLRFCLPPKNVDRYDIKCSFGLLYYDRLKLEVPLTSENHFKLSLPINFSFFSRFVWPLVPFLVGTQLPPWSWIFYCNWDWWFPGSPFAFCGFYQLCALANNYGVYPMGLLCHSEFSYASLIAELPDFVADKTDLVGSSIFNGMLAIWQQ